MKAKQYVAMFQEWERNPPKLSEIFDGVPEEHASDPADHSDLVIHLAHEVLKEFHPICDARRARTPEALGAVVRELNQKWHAICNRLPNVPPEIFLLLAFKIGGTSCSTT